MTHTNKPDSNELDEKFTAFMQHVRIVPASECALILYIDQPLSDKLGVALTRISKQVEVLAGNINLEIIASYASLLISYLPLETDHFARKNLLLNAIKTMLNSSDPLQQHQNSTLVELPVFYSKQTGPDLERIAHHHKLSTDAVIKLHQQEVYRVFAIGFAPGFAYLGQVSEQIAMPRLATPRNWVPKGAVAIADRQTAVYPAASPGGWNIIGQCPMLMFDPKRNPSMPFSVGDTVRFKAVDKDRYLALGGEL